MGIGGADFQGAVGNLVLVFHPSVFSTAHNMGAITNRDGAIQVLLDGDGLTGE